MPNLQHVLAACAALLAITLTGCPKKPADSPAPAAAPPKAEARWEKIVEEMTRELVSDDPRNSRDPGLPGGGYAEGSHQLTSELQKPADGDGVYHGSITITRRYKMVAFTGSQDEDAVDEEQGSSAESAGAGPDEIETLTPEGAQPTLHAAPPITARDNVKVRTFELEYRDNRWVQITKTDPETEKAIQAVFDYALAKQ